MYHWEAVLDISQLRNQAKERAEKTKEAWKEMEKTKRFAIVAGALVVIAAIGFSLYFLTKKEYSVLYSDMEAAEAGEIYNLLQDQGTDVKLRGSDTILVNAKDADAIRLELSAEGYPKSGLNYDIFEGASSFGTTDMEKQVYLKFQLEQNLSATIKKLGKIKNATVMINLASESKFVLSGQGSTPASASIVLEVANGETLSNSEAESIRNLVKTSVPDLKSENITIVDSSMKMYNDSDEAGVDINSEQLALQQQTKQNLEQQIENLLTPVFGQGKVSTSVNVVLDFDKRVTTSVTFEPPVEGEEQGLIVSMKELTEQINGGTAVEGAVGVDPNGGTTTYPTVETNEDGTYYKTTREFNAEVNETKEQIESARGQIAELSIAVIIDGDQNTVSDEVLTMVSDLVSKGIGVEPENVSVARMAFQQNAEIEAAIAEQDAMLRREMYLKYGSIIAVVLVIAITALVLLLLHWHKKKKEREYEEALAAQKAAEEAAKVMPGGVDFLVGEDISIDDLQAKDSENAEKIFKLVENNPEAVAQLLRNWLDDDYGR